MLDNLLSKEKHVALQEFLIFATPYCVVQYLEHCHLLNQDHLLEVDHVLVHHPILPIPQPELG